MHGVQSLAKKFFSEGDPKMTFFFDFDPSALHVWTYEKNHGGLQGVSGGPTSNEKEIKIRSRKADEKCNFSFRCRCHVQKWGKEFRFAKFR